MKKFFQSRVAELNNVTWPTQKQAVHSMITVLVIMAVIGVFLTLIDSVFKEAAISLLTK